MNTLLPGTRFEGKPKEKGHLIDKTYRTKLQLQACALYICIFFTLPCIMRSDPEMDSDPKCPERKDTDPGLNLS
jgi:hypothetical protein